jgi:methyltransferase
MKTYLLLVTGFVAVQRVAELLIAKKNARHMKSRGAQEVGSAHYKYLVLIHLGFFLSLLGEVTLGHGGSPSWWPIPLVVFILAQLLRYWCIRSLGPFWNTRIYVLAESGLINKGPYRRLKHPNYLVVRLEFLTLPLIFGAYETAAIFSMFNYAFLKWVRIPTEEKALQLALKK